MRKYEDDGRKKRNLDKEHWVVKRNILNEVKNNKMTFQEKRFFCIYLAKIDPRNIETKKVKFSLSEFNSVMGLKVINVDYYRNVFTKLLGHCLKIPNESGNGGYSVFQLFKRCKIDKEVYNGEWYVEIEAHEDALPLLFNFKRDFFKYRLWNALGLSSGNQLSMYENLKQMKNLGKVVMPVDELKQRLGIKKDQYPRFDGFRVDVLEPCKKALKDNTDIKFNYESYGKKGRGGKILQLLITIEENKDYKKQINLEEFLTEEELNPYEESDTMFLEEYYSESEKTESPSPNICETYEELHQESDEEAQKLQKEILRLSKKLYVIKNKSDRTISESFEPRIAHINVEEIQSHPLYWVARAVTDRKTDGKQGIKIRKTPEKYAIGILNNWDESGFKTIESLIKAGEITEKDCEKAQSMESTNNW